MEITARWANFDAACRNVIFGYWQDHLVNKVSRTFMVYHCSRPELGDSQETRPGKKLIPRFLRHPPTRNKSRQWQSGEVVTREKAFARKIPIAVKIGLK